MAERKKLPGLLYDKSTDWWFSNLKDPSKKCGRTKYMWAKDQHKAQSLYFEQIEDARSWPLIEMAGRCARAQSSCSSLVEEDNRFPGISSIVMASWPVLMRSRTDLTVSAEKRA